MRSLDQSGKSNSIDLARAVHYAVDEGFEIINCSWGGGRVTLALEGLRELDAGILVLTSAGNDKINVDQSPQVDFTGVINVIYRLQ